MSSRALRKLQREQELQKQLAAAREAQDEQQESDGEAPEPETTTPIPKNAFDMLEEVEDEDSDSDEHVDKVALEPNPATSTAPRPSSSMPSHPSKPKKKKKKTKKKSKDVPAQATPVVEDSGDEIDRALKELKAKRPAGDPANDEPDFTANWEIMATKNLAIDSRNLNPITEMRSLFGNVALEGESRSTPRNQRRREQNEQGGVDLATALTGRYTVASRGKELGTLASRRNVFMQGKEEWPLAASGGLSMEHTKDPMSFERRYNIIHNNLYQETQNHFGVAVESMDPQRMLALLSMSPYHIATLLQVSEIAKHQGDHSVSGDLLERALFSFGRSVHSSFPMAMRDGTARLSFDRASNRELYLTIWRYIRNLEMRGTWKTAFEWTKLLLQLNTLSDPFGVTLMIDQFALRGRSHDQLLTLASDSAYGNAWRHLPNIQISLVLAYLRSKEGRQARKQLALCIHHYPYIISALASALGISPIPKSLWAKLPTTDAETLYAELYVSRAKDLWNTPETSALIVEVADTLSYYSSSIDSSSSPPKLEISLEEARHIMLLEIPSLISLLPRRFTAMHTSSFDVLPPPNSQGDSDFIARAPTDASGTSALQAIFNAGSATAGATRDTITRLLTDLRNWYDTPVSNDEEGQAALRDLQREFGREGMSPEMVEQFLHAHFAEDEDEDDERFTLADIGINLPNAAPMAGDWDYYADAAENASSADATTDENDNAHDSMPELEDVPTQETRPTAAPTPPPQRNPRAAIVEEDADDAEDNPETTLHGPVSLTAAGRAVLRHVDSDSENDAEPEIERDPQPQRPPVSAISSSTTQPPTTTRTSEVDASLETDPQRLQRWLLTTGLTALQTDSSHAATALYVRRLRVLRKPQQEWILNMVVQSHRENEGVKEVVGRVRREMTSSSSS